MRIYVEVSPRYANRVCMLLEDGDKTYHLSYDTIPDICFAESVDNEVALKELTPDQLRMLYVEVSSIASARA